MERKIHPEMKPHHPITRLDHAKHCLLEPVQTPAIDPVFLMQTNRLVRIPVQSRRNERLHPVWSGNTFRNDGTRSTKEYLGRTRSITIIALYYHPSGKIQTWHSVTSSPTSTNPACYWTYDIDASEGETAAYHCPIQLHYRDR